MKTKTVLIVGAGIGQVPAIKEANRLGYTTITVDKNPDAVGMNVADLAYEIDIIDYDSILEVAKKQNIDAAITLQSDLPVPIIGRLNDELNLKGVTHEVANWCSNKIETRKRLKERGVPQPNFQIVSSYAEAKTAVEVIGLPCVIKSPDSSGSRGVTKVKSQEKILQACQEAQKYSRIDEFLVEEFISGLEFGAQTFSVNGTCERVLLHNDQLSAPPYMIPVGHSFPFRYLAKDQQQKVSENIASAVEALKINNGPANVDLILDEKTNEIRILEIGARIGATCLPELVEYHTGINWIVATLKNALGKSVDLTPKKNAPVAALILKAPQDGIFEGYDFLSSDRSNLIEFEVTAQEGDKVQELKKGTDRIGKVVSLGNSAIEAEQNAKKYSECIKVYVRDE